MIATPLLLGLMALLLAVVPAPLPARGAAAASDRSGPTPLRLEGSNTVGDKLAPDLFRSWAATQRLDAVKVIEGSQPDESELVASGSENDRQLRATIHAHGTGTGLDPLVAGTADIWMASRPANNGELAKAAKAGFGNMLDPSNEHTIALDALLIIVHKDNPVRKLTIDQVADLFSGKIANWSEVGGRNAPIDVYSRDAKSGTFDTFSSLVLHGRKLVASAKLFEGASEELSDQVASDPNGIGFIGFAYERNARALSIATDCGMAITPTAFAVKAGEYPLSRRLYLYTPAHVTPAIAEFVRFATSLDAQKTVSASDFIDLAPATAPARYTADRLDTAADAHDNGQVVPRSTDLLQLEDATTGARRLSISLRFLAGSDQLDSLARGDIDRLSEILHHPEFAAAKVVLIGFSQSLGDYGLNRSTSRNRAVAVRRELEARGVPIELSVGVGPAAPIACNTDDASRARNQRVEVWIRLPPG